jgi:hypothetical protein
VFYGCVLLAFYCIVTLNLKLERMNEDITGLAREAAIEGAMPPKDKEDKQCSPSNQSY